MPSPNEADPPPTDPLLLRLALRAYPAVDREGYGDELLEAASELAADSSLRREAWGLVLGGAQARLARTRAGLGAVDLRAALDRASLPVAALVVMVWGIAAVARITGAVDLAGRALGPSPGSVLLLAALAILTVAVARRQRGLAVAASLVLAVQVTASAIWLSARGGIVTAAPSLHLHLGAWWFGPSLVWSLLPFVVLLIPATLSMRPPAPRVPGLARPWQESAFARAALLLTPALLVGAILEVAPTLLLEGGGSGETTELPGILTLMLIVGALWLATSAAVSSEAVAVAAALIGLAAVPSVAYGAARLLTAPIRPEIASLDLVIVLVLGVGALLVVLAALAFALVIASIGLRTLDRRGGPALALGHAVGLTPGPELRAD